MAAAMLAGDSGSQARPNPPATKAFRHAGVFELGEPTMAEGETFADFMSDPSTREDFDVDAAAERDYGLVRLHQLALRHLVG